MASRKKKAAAKATWDLGELLMPDREPGSTDSKVTGPTVQLEPAASNEAVHKAHDPDPASASIASREDDPQPTSSELVSAAEVSKMVMKESGPNGKNSTTRAYEAVAGHPPPESILLTPSSDAANSYYEVVKDTMAEHPDDKV